MPLVTQATFTRFHAELKMYENTSYCEKSIIILPFDSNQLKPKCIYHTQILEGTSTVRSGSTSARRCSFSPFHHVFFCLHFFRFSFYAFTFFLIFLRKNRRRQNEKRNAWTRTTWSQSCWSCCFCCWCRCSCCCSFRVVFVQWLGMRHANMHLLYKSTRAWQMWNNNNNMKTKKKQKPNTKMKRFSRNDEKRNQRSKTIRQKQASLLHTEEVGTEIFFSNARARILFYITCTVDRSRYFFLIAL